MIGKGDVQWMTAARGVLHKEFHETEWSKKGGIFQMVQLWVNLPAKYKMSEPKYQALKNEDIQRFVLDSNQGEIEVIAGNYQGVKGLASTFSPMEMYNAKLEKGAEVHLSLPANYNTALLVLEGSITINNQEQAPNDHLVLMANDGENFSITADEKAIVLVLGGEPINEPIAARGPFVMNTREELIQAFDDFKSGKFGTLED